jgi:hypothetical protein
MHTTNYEYLNALKTFGYQIRVFQRLKVPLSLVILKKIFRFSKKKTIIYKAYSINKLKCSKNINPKTYFFSENIDYKYFDNFIPLVIKKNLFPHIIITKDDLLNNPQFKNYNITLEKKVPIIYEKLSLNNFNIFSKKNILINLSYLYKNIAMQIINNFLNKVNTNVYFPDNVYPLYATLINLNQNYFEKLISLNSSELESFEYVYQLKAKLYTRFSIQNYKYIGTTIIQKLYFSNLQFFEDIRFKNENKSNFKIKIKDKLKILYVSQNYENKSKLYNIFFRFYELNIIIFIIILFWFKSFTKNKFLIKFRPHPREKKYDIKNLVFKIFSKFSPNDIYFSNPEVSSVYDDMNDSSIILTRNSTTAITYASRNLGLTFIFNKNYYQKLKSVGLKNIYFFSFRRFFNTLKSKNIENYLK